MSMYKYCCHYCPHNSENHTPWTYSYLAMLKTVILAIKCIHVQLVIGIQYGFYMAIIFTMIVVNYTFQI